MITHHPDETLVVEYVCGVCDEPTSLIVATHLHFCSSCRADAAQIQSIGGNLLSELEPQALAADALDKVLARLDEITPYERERRSTSQDGTPGVLKPYLGGELEAVVWRKIGPRLSYVPLLRRGSVVARLLRGVPGAESGMHTHAGVEYTLVLKGGYTDETGSYAPGDLQVMAKGLRHNPIADPGEDCINLAVTTGRLKFDNVIQKIAAPLFGF